MYVRRKIRWRLILLFAWRNLVIFLVWATLITTLRVYLGGRGVELTLPFLPISMIGIAVAFYIGFKNTHDGAGGQPLGEGIGGALVKGRDEAFGDYSLAPEDERPDPSHVIVPPRRA